MKGHCNRTRFEPDRTCERQRGRVGRWRRLMRKRRLVALGLMIPALGLGVGLAGCGGSSSSTAATTTSAASTSAASSAGPPAGGSHSFTGDPRFGGGSGGSNARSTNAAGGSVGTVTGVSGSSFTVSTPRGEKVTVKKTSSTVYDKGTVASSASAVTKGETVLVLGKVNGTTITASQVTVDPAINLSKAAANVVAFKQGTQGASKSVGQIPSDYKEGSGTIVSRTTATKATQAALTKYAGGVVDRVVRLSNGEYEVHYIGANWPHHIFVNSSFQVVGAD
jgi:ribosomal protein L18E